jgi:hypothetical protein
MYELGDTSRKDHDLLSMRGARGRAESVYMNRAFFGLFSLLHRLRAEIETRQTQHS